MPRPDEVLQTPLQFLRGVGPRKAADFQRAGLRTLEDLLYRFPLRYEDRSRLQPIAVTARRADTASVSGELVQCGLRATRRPGFRIFEALVRDASGAVRGSLVQLVLPEGSAAATSAARAARHARAKPVRAAVHQPRFRVD